METIFILIVFLYSIILHEISHAYVAYKFGDPTAKYERRLTLNPIFHIDPLGSIILPLFTFITTGFIFGWAKPVPYNPYNLKNPERDSIYIALAGPLINIILALFFTFLYKILSTTSPILFLNLKDILLFGIRINLILAFFNLLPLPPLDGSKLLLSKISLEVYQFLETWGFFLVIIFLLFFSPYFFNFISLIQNWLLNI